MQLRQFRSQKIVQHRQLRLHSKQVSEGDMSDFMSGTSGSDSKIEVELDLV